MPRLAIAQLQECVLHWGFACYWLLLTECTAVVHMHLHSSHLDVQMTFQPLLQQVDCKSCTLWGRVQVYSVKWMSNKPTAFSVKCPSTEL